MTNTNAPSTPLRPGRQSMKDAYFAYRMTTDGWFSVAFCEATGKKYARGYKGRKMLATRCQAAAEKNPKDTYAVVNLETYEIADLHGKLLREQMEAISSDNSYRNEENHDESVRRRQEAGPISPLVYTVARRCYRSLLDVAEGVYETRVLNYRFPGTEDFERSLRRRSSTSGVRVRSKARSTNSN